MRHTTVLAALALLLPATAAAQRPAHPAVTQTLAANVLALPFGVASAEYERALGGGFAAGVGGLASFATGDGSAFDDGEAYRSLEAKLKYYPREDGLRGFAVGLTAGVASERRTYHSGDFYTLGPDGNLLPSGSDVPPIRRVRTAPTLGVTFDYDWLIGRRHRVLLGLGVGAKRAIGVGAGEPLDRVLSDGRFQIGIGF